MVDADAGGAGATSEKLAPLAVVPRLCPVHIE